MMARYRDREKLGNSTVSKYKAGEDYKSRHARRRRHAMRPELLAHLNDWLADNKLVGEFQNDFHHLLINPEGWPLDGPRQTIHLAQWWPSTAKLVIANRWADGIHCHDVYQLTKRLDQELPKVTQPRYVQAALNYNANNLRGSA